jgi:hypothetical protein
VAKEEKREIRDETTNNDNKREIRDGTTNNDNKPIGNNVRSTTCDTATVNYTIAS